MRPLVLSACVLLALAAFLPGRAFATDQPDPLARARTLYNQHQFDAAVAAADEARSSRADSADLVAARAYLEKFRESDAAEDLASARERLRRIDAGRLDAKERTEFLVGLGEDLFFDQSPGAAAAIFDSVLTGSPTQTAEQRDRVLDWWASALDREAHPRPDIERQGVYLRIRERMRSELGNNPGSAPALYWSAAAALGQGDLQAAWDAALAAWVRAPLTPDRGAILRGDLDLLVDRGIAPERSKILNQPADSLRAEWQAFKEKWSK